MTVCPIAIVVGCKKCPAFSICPAKSLLGDQPSLSEQAGKQSTDSTDSKK